MKKAIFLSSLIICLALCTLDASGQKRKTPVRKRPVQAVITAPEGLLAEAKLQAVEFKPGARDADGWTLYESTEDSFRLAFPSPPVVTDSTDNSGKKDGNRYYDPEPAAGTRLSLTMMVQPLGLPSIDADFKRKVYAAWAEGVLAEQGGQKTTLVSQKEFAFENSFGLEIVADHGAYRFRGRIVCPADKCYQYSAGSGTPAALKPEENIDAEKGAKKFLDSFQLVK
jgi:hypothetical protein